MKLNFLFISFTCLLALQSFAAQPAQPIDALENFQGEYLAAQNNPSLCLKNLRVSCTENSLTGTSLSQSVGIITLFDIERIGAAPVTSIQRDGWGDKYRSTVWNSFDPKTLSVSAHEVARSYFPGFPPGAYESIGFLKRRCYRCSQHFEGI